MTQDILNPVYWQQRLKESNRTERHHAIFKCPMDQWQRIEAQHRKLLDRYVGPYTSILDGGCGWGRLIPMLPRHWHGRYYGIDLSPDFIDIANKTYGLERDLLGNPRYWFGVGDLRSLEEFGLQYMPVDMAVLISIRPMIIRNLGEEEWAKIRTELGKVCRKILYLEYDPDDQGELEVISDR